MQQEMMSLFNDAKRSGCIIEVRSKSKVENDRSPSANDRHLQISSRNLNRRKTKEEMHAEMLSLFEDAKASGCIIEVSERPEVDVLWAAPAQCSPLSNGAIVNRIVTTSHSNSSQVSQGLHGETFALKHGHL